MDCARYAEGDDLQFLRDALATKSSVLDFRDDLGRTPSHMAAANGNVEALRILVDAGAAPLPNFEGNTALHYAAVNNQAACAKLLLETKRWKVATRNAFGKTALQEIGEKQFDDMEGLLMEFDEELDNYVCPPTATMDVPADSAEEEDAPADPQLPKESVAESVTEKPVDADYKTKVMGSSAVDDIE